MALGAAAVVAAVAAASGAPPATSQLPPLLPAPTASPAPTPTSSPSPLPSFKTPPQGPVLARFSYAHGLGDWQAVQQPAGTQRIQVVKAPGTRKDRRRPRGKAASFEVRPGDDTVTGGYHASRAEVYGRHAKPSTTPIEQWPDPLNAERWYAFSFYLPKDLVLATDTKYLILTQWKGRYSGSPALTIELHRDRLRLSGRYVHEDLGKAKLGAWTRVVVGMKISPDPNVGWVTVFRDGKLALPVRHGATMRTRTRGDGVVLPDPQYLKQGLYRSRSWTVTQRVFIGPLQIRGPVAAAG